MALITQADLQARLQRNLTAEESSAFTTINAALQAEVERMIGSSVEAVDPSTRYYDGGYQHLAIDPCTDVTSVRQVGDDDSLIYAYVTTDFAVEPRNRTLKRMIRHRTSRGFVHGIGNVAVTAKFSIHDDAETLAIVKNAMLEALISEMDNSDNILKESLEGYSVEYAKAETKNNLASIKYLFPGT
jgi:hypothetical protein